MGSMTDRLIYLIGQPGSGKSTLMANLIADYDQVPAVSEGAGLPHVQLINRITGAVIGAEVGIHRDLFSGTDALASSIIDKAAPWIASTPYPLVLAEGARLANRRFLLEALDGDYHVTLALLDHENAEVWRHKRAKKIGREQHPSWVKGRLTASRNLADEFTNMSVPGASPFSDQITVLRGHPDILEPQLAAIVADND